MKDKESYPVDESMAGEYIGKVVFIDISYENPAGEISARQQWAGVITTYSNQEGIRAELFDLDEVCALPPSPDVIKPAKPGIYRLRSTGREIENPDYVANWILKAPGARK
jgi:hypothetical protein